MARVLHVGRRIYTSGKSRLRTGAQAHERVRFLCL